MVIIGPYQTLAIIVDDFKSTTKGYAYINANEVQEDKVEHFLDI